MKTLLFQLLSSTVLLLCAVNLAAAVDLKELDAHLAEVQKFEYGADDKSMMWVESTVADACREGNQRKDVESALLRTLNDSSATTTAKAFLCKQLRVIGSDAAVPHLKKLLSDKNLSHPARIALGSMKSNAAMQALLDALDSAEGNAAIGIINSLGEHRYRPARKKIAGMMGDHSNRKLTLACVRALGLLGDRSVLDKVQFKDAGLVAAVHNARLRLADSVLKAGKNAEAEAIYRGFYEKGNASHLRVAGLRGLVAADSKAVMDMLVNAALDKDSGVGRAAVRLLANSKDAGATKLLALLPKLSADRQPVLIPAIGRLGDKKLVPVIAKYAHADEVPVRIAAMEALGSLGGEESVQILARAAGTREGDEARAARHALRRLPRNFDPGAALGALEKGKPEPLIEVIRAFADSGMANAQPRLVKIMTGDGDAKVRQEAIRSLGKLATIATAGPLLKMLREPGTVERSDIERALSQIIARTTDPADAASKIIPIGPALPAEARPGWVRLLVQCPTPEALETVRKAMDDSNADIADAAVRTLADWPKHDAAGTLLAIARKPQKPVHKILALQGYVRLAKDASDSEAMFSQAMQLAGRVADKRVVLSGLANGKSPKALDLVEPFLHDGELREEAASAAIAIAARLRNEDPARAKTTAERVSVLTKDKRTRRRAEKLLSDLDKK